MNVFGDLTATATQPTVTSHSYKLLAAVTNETALIPLIGASRCQRRVLLFKFYTTYATIRKVAL